VPRRSHNSSYKRCAGAESKNRSNQETLPTKRVKGQFHSSRYLFFKLSFNQNWHSASMLPVSLPDGVVEILDKEVVDKLGEGYSDTLRQIIMNWLSEQGYLAKGRKNEKS
jgi:hypothetical protein